MLDAGSSFENFAPRSIEVNQLDGQNLFADVVVLDADAGKFIARGGRQEILLGLSESFHRLSGPIHVDDSMEED